MQSVRQSTQFKKLNWVLQPRKQGHPTKRWGHTSVLHDGRLLVFGGNHKGVTREGVYKLDCQTLKGDALRLAVQPQMRQSHSCTLYQDCLYIYGGCINQKVTSDLLQVKLTGMNPSWRKLQQRNPIPPRESHVAVLIQKKFMLVYGGVSPQDIFLDEFWLLDLQSVSWYQVRQIRGQLQARIGANMTVFGNEILSFGGQWGDGQDSHYSNDIFKLKFQGDLKIQHIPPLSITKVQVLGRRPNPRTGHSSVDYKGKMLIVVGGEGLRNNRDKVLFNDIWAFDIRSNNWIELVVENRASFRARANFTANIYKNTIYIFGGFINLSTYGCTDQLTTLTLSENKHSQRQQNEHRAVAQVQAQNGNVPHFCSQCKFQFVPHQRPVINNVQHIIPNNNFLVSSTQNIIHAARSIDSPFEGIGLVLQATSSLVPHQHKQIYIDLVTQNVSSVDQQLAEFFEKAYLKINIKGLTLTRDELQRVVYSYKCELNDEGFDLKNGLFRLGKEVLICQLFEDGMLHAYLLTGEGIFRSVLHLQTIIYELECKENKLVGEYLNHYKINLEDIEPFNLHCFVGSLTKEKKNGLQLKLNGKDFIWGKSQKSFNFREFIKDYFLGQKNIALKLNGDNVQLLSYENQVRNQSKQLEQQPQTEHFSKVHLVGFQHQVMSEPAFAYVKLYALGRKVGVYRKYPFISGFLQLSDISNLNFPRTKCVNLQIETFLKVEIESWLQECNKRKGQVGVAQLQRQASN